MWGRRCYPHLSSPKQRLGVALGPWGRDTEGQNTSLNPTSLNFGSIALYYLAVVRPALCFYSCFF